MQVGREEAQLQVVFQVQGQPCSTHGSQDCSENWHLDGESKKDGGNGEESGAK